MKKLLLFIMLASGLSAFSQPCITNTNSLLFNGSSNYVSFTSDNNLQITDSITVEAWIYPTTFAVSVFQGTILCKHSWSSGEQGFVLRAGGSGQVSFNLAGLDTNSVPLSWQDLTSPVNAISLNTWSHVAGTYDGDTMRLFVNGVQVATMAVKGSIVASTAFPASIGKISDTVVGQTRYWIGRIDEVRVWHRALPGAEILANKGKHIDPLTSPNLVGYWRFNDGSGTTATDLSTSGNNGFVNGATWIPLVPFTQAAAMPLVIPNGTLLTCLQTFTAYQWNFSTGAANPIANATQQTYTATQNGNYTVTVTDSLGCHATSSPYFMTGVVGLLELSKNVNASILNADGKVTVSFSDGTIINNGELFDASGRLVEAVGIGKSTSIAFESAKVVSGMYILQLNTSKGTFSSKLQLGN